jgi:hypothetical protein
MWRWGFPWTLEIEQTANNLGFGEAANACNRP